MLEAAALPIEPQPLHRSSLQAWDARLPWKPTWSTSTPTAASGRRRARADPRSRSTSTTSRRWTATTGRFFYPKPNVPNWGIKSITFLAQSMHIKLALPWAAQLSLFYRKISSVAPPWETWIKTRYWEDREGRKKPAPGGHQSHNLSGMRRALYPCATTATVKLEMLS